MYKKKEFFRKIKVMLCFVVILNTIMVSFLNAENKKKPLFIKEAEVEHIKILEWLKKVSKPYKGVTIRMITETTPPSQWIEKIKNEFTQSTGINVIIEKQPHPYLEEKALSDFKTKKGTYDIFNGDYSWTGKYVQNKYVLPLTDFLNNKKLTYPKYNKSDFYKGFWNGTSWKGIAYGLPYDSVIEYMFYNKTDFEKAGLVDKNGNPEYPKTPKEWLATVKKLHNPPFVYGCGIQGKRHLAVVLEFLTILWAFDGEIYNGNFIAELNKDSALNALKFYKKLSKYSPSNSTNWTWNETAIAMQKHIIASTILWDENYGMMEDVKNSNVVGNISYSTIPSISNKVISHYGGSSLFIPSSSKHKNAAYLFAQWATSYPVQLLGVGKGASPTRKTIYRIPELRKKYPSFIATDAAAPNTGMRPRIPEWSEMVEIMAKELNLVITGNKKPEKALEIMHYKVNSILEKAGYQKGN